ncbi:MAG: hypothetical protein PVH87_25130 [Desulfobacteraceae bacterium]
MRSDRFVERGRVNGVEWLRSHGSCAQGLVIAPPLIGGHAIQQLRLLRPLVKSNLDLISFSYAGHGGSRGAFSLKAALDNSLTALDLAISQSRREGLPLFGFASCFAAIPLLHAVQQRNEPLAKMVLINALPHLRWEKMVFDFYRYWRKSRHWQPSLQGLKTALQTYRDDLLPNVRHRHQAFGILSRQRVRWPRMMRDLFTLRKLDAKPIRSTPVLCIYGQHDRMLQHVGFSDWAGYEALIEQICPRTQFWRINSDHFITGSKIRRQLIERVIRFFR